MHVKNKDTIRSDLRTMTENIFVYLSEACSRTTSDVGPASFLSQKDLAAFAHGREPESNMRSLRGLLSQLNLDKDFYDSAVVHVRAKAIERTLYSDNVVKQKFNEKPNAFLECLTRRDYLTIRNKLIIDEEQEKCVLNGSESLAKKYGLPEPFVSGLLSYLISCSVSQQVKWCETYRESLLLFDKSITGEIGATQRLEVLREGLRAGSYKRFHSE